LWDAAVAAAKAVAKAPQPADVGPPRCVYCGRIGEQPDNLIIRVAFTERGREWVHAKCWASLIAMQEAELDLAPDSSPPEDEWEGG
jgi:hypothetical protein